MTMTGMIGRLAVLCTTALAAGPALAAEPAAAKARHVLLISVDGLHSVDVARFIAKNPGSVLAQLSARGVTYSDAQSSFPSDSFPGLLALVTGGTPRSTGVYYDDSYDRKLALPGKCDQPGAEIDYTAAMNADKDALDTVIDAKKLPVDPARGCAPVWPHQFLRTNTVFEVVREAGGRTAWADKHPVYELVHGPSGKGVMDLYTPEIDSAGDIPGSVDKTIDYDDLKVRAILNQIAGWDHGGSVKAAAPALFGMNFQAVSVAQKLPRNGYLDALATPSDGLAKALAFVDTALGRMTVALKQNKLFDSTLIIVTAKHAQSPIDPAKRRIIDGKLLSVTVNSLGDGLAAQVTTDSVALIWLKDQTRTADAAAQLAVNQRALGIAKIYAGAELSSLFADPLTDSRAPDIVIQPEVGVIYSKPTATKIAEHGGAAFDDRQVALLVAHPALQPGRVSAPVSTVQVAPTILKSLGLDPRKLQSVRIEHTQPLPGLVMRPSITTAAR